MDLKEKAQLCYGNLSALLDLFRKNYKIPEVFCVFKEIEKSFSKESLNFRKSKRPLIEALAHQKGYENFKSLLKEKYYFQPFEKESLPLILAQEEKIA